MAKATKKFNKKVLIVEDDKDFLSILQTKFTADGFSVVVAENGEEGVIVAEKEKPDLIFSDILIPALNGIEMAKKIRESNKEVAVIFLTNMRDENYLKEIEKSGFSYLIKSDLRISEIVDKAKEKLGIK